MFLQSWWKFLALSFITLTLVGALLLGLASALIYPDLPSLEALTNYKPKLPLRVYSEDGYLLAEYGEERRMFFPWDEHPCREGSGRPKLYSSVLDGTG